MIKIATEGQFYNAKDEIEAMAFEIARKYDLDTYQLIRILAMMTSELAYHARRTENN